MSDVVDLHEHSVSGPIENFNQSMLKLNLLLWALHCPVFTCQLQYLCISSGVGTTPVSEGATGLCQPRSRSYGRNPQPGDMCVINSLMTWVEFRAPVAT